jgi:hypothetical protein
MIIITVCCVQSSSVVYSRRLLCTVVGLLCTVVGRGYLSPTVHVREYKEEAC